MVLTTISFEDGKTTPPIYVAGTFSDWQVTELDAIMYKDNEGRDKYRYSKILDLVPGTYQYKFRLGPGEWWICDGHKPKALDSIGNENNVLWVKDCELPVRFPELKNLRDLSAVRQLRNTMLIDHDTTNIASEDTQGVSKSVATRRAASNVLPDVPNQFLNTIIQQQASFDRIEPGEARSDTAKSSRDDHPPNDEEHTASQTDARAWERDIGAERLADGVASASHVKMSASSERISRELDGKLRGVSFVSFRPSEHSDAAVDEPTTELQDRRGGELSSLWPSVNPKRLLLAAIFVAVPIAVAYYLRRTGLRLQ